MLFNIAESNAEKVKTSFTATENPHTLPGYKKSAILKPRSRRASYVYEVNIIDNTCIVCTVRHEEAETTEAIIKLCNYMPVSIEVERGELFRNCSNYPYRTETSNRYFKKYNQIACIVHGAIKAGLLFDTKKEDPEPVKAANETPKRRTAYRVECRSPRRTWTPYAAETETREESARIMEEAETRHTLTPDGSPVFYRIVQIDKGPETVPETVKTEAAGETPTAPETVPTTNGSTTGEAETTAAKTEPQRAAETPKSPTDGETRPRSYNATTGSQDGHRQHHQSRPAWTNHAPPPPSGYKTSQTAPTQHETSKGVQTTSRSNKSPPRAKQDDKTSRTSETRINSSFSRFWAKIGQKQNTHSPATIFTPEFFEKSTSFFQA